MAKNAYVTVNGVLRKVKNIYASVNAVNRKVIKAYVTVNGRNRQWWPNAFMPPEQGFQLTGNGWNGYAKDDSVYRDWQSALYGRWYDRPKQDWTLSSVGGWDISQLRWVDPGPGSNKGLWPQGQLVAGTIGPIPAGRYRRYYRMYNSDSSHRHQLWIVGARGTVYDQKYWITRGTGEWNDILTIPEPHYIWSEYWTDDGWANEYGDATFRYLGA